MRFIHIGVGGFGKTWVNVLKQNRRAKVVALVDKSPEALADACHAAGYPDSICYSSLDEAIHATQADALVCVTPPGFHREHLTTAMHAGLHALSEKPMAPSLTDCKAILKVARDTDKTCVISQNYRYRPTTWTLADQIRAGRIGEVGQIKIDFYKGVDFRGFRAEMEYPLLIDMAIHHFDLIRWITGANARRVSGRSWNPSWSRYRGDGSCSLVFEMDNQSRVVYSGSWCAQGDYATWDGNWLIEGSHGTLRYEQDEITHLTVPHSYKATRSRILQPRKRRHYNQSYVLNHFMRSIQRGETPDTDVRDNIHSIAMIFAAVQAVRTRKAVNVYRPTGQSK